MLCARAFSAYLKITKRWRHRHCGPGFYATRALQGEFHFLSRRHAMHAVLTRASRLWIDPFRTVFAHSFNGHAKRRPAIFIIITTRSTLSRCHRCGVVPYPTHTGRLAGIRMEPTDQMT